MPKTILIVHLISNLIGYRILDWQQFLLSILKALLLCLPACQCRNWQVKCYSYGIFSFYFFGSLKCHPGVVFIGYSIGLFNLSFSPWKFFGIISLISSSSIFSVFLS